MAQLGHISDENETISACHYRDLKCFSRWTTYMPRNIYEGPKCTPCKEPCNSKDKSLVNLSKLLRYQYEPQLSLMAKDYHSWVLWLPCITEIRTLGMHCKPYCWAEADSQFIAILKSILSNTLTVRCVGWSTSWLRRVLHLERLKSWHSAWRQQRRIEGCRTCCISC